MRTSRGLQVTSLVVLTPVLLILLTLLTILITTIFSQLQSWCPPVYEALPDMTKWIYTSTSLVHMNDTLSPSIQDANSTPYAMTIDNSYNNANINSYRSPFLIQIWLKRWRYFKRKSPALWVVCGGSIFLYYTYLHKSQAQKRQLYRSVINSVTLMTRTIICNFLHLSKQVMLKLKYIWTGSYQHKLESSDYLGKKKNDKDGSIKPTERFKSTLGTIQRHGAKKSKKHRSYQHQSSIHDKRQPHITRKLVQHLDLDITEKSTNYTSDWIITSDKEKKATTEAIKECIIERVGLNNHDKSVVEDILKTENGKHPTTYHHHHQQQHESSEIHNMYSPFSTGLDLDLAPRFDPLTLLDPLRSPSYQLPDHHQAIPLLQYYPFIITPSRHPPPSSFGPVGQPASVQNSKHPSFSLSP